MKFDFSKLICSALLFFVASTVEAQVGIGTTSPGASLEVKNTNNDSLIFKLKGNDLLDKLVVRETGEIFISDPVNDESSERFLSVDNDNIIRYRNWANIKPTGLERINEGNGDGWRLIGRNPNDYANIGYQAVDFGLCQSGSNKGAAGAFSFIGPGINNYTSSNFQLNHVIIGGNNNFIQDDGSDTGIFGVSIVGGNSNDVFSNSTARTFLHGNNNKFEKYSYGALLGSNNIIRFDSSLRGIGNNNELSEKSKGIIFGDFNIIGKAISGTMLGNNNQVGNFIDSKGEHGGYVFGSNNINNSGKSFLIGTGNNGQQNGGKNYSFLIGNNNSNNQAMPSFLFGNDLINRVPFHVVLGQYNEILDSSHPTTMVAYEISELPQSYYSITNDPVFTVGIGYKNQTGGIVRKDGFRVYRNGKVEIRQSPATNNTSEKIYARDIDGTFVLRDANSLISSFFSTTNYSGAIDNSYLNSNYSTASIGHQVYSEASNKIYVKISGTNWISYNTNLIP